jgi:hypothetical protein
VAMNMRTRCQVRGAVWVGAIMIGLVVPHSPVFAQIEIGGDEVSGVWVRSSGEPLSGQVLLLERSLDLQAPGHRYSRSTRLHHLH